MNENKVTKKFEEKIRSKTGKRCRGDIKTNWK
jgi:hypothetical protein